MSTSNPTGPDPDQPDASDQPAPSASADQPAPSASADQPAPSASADQPEPSDQGPSEAAAPPPPPPPPPLPGSGPTGPTGPRPTTVTAAVGLMYVGVVLGLVGLVVNLLTRDTARDSVRRSLEKAGETVTDDKVSTAVNFNTAGSVVSTLIIVVAFIVLARLVLRGVQVARIITWVLSGVLLLCCTGASIYAVAGSDSQYLPGWLVAYTWFAVIVQIVSLVGIIVLLALPASNTYFRRTPNA
jgi:hypothetical protein